MNNPKISIIIGCYNSERFIKDTLDSILNQTYKNWECLCVNDGSKDNTLSILQEYAVMDSRIKVFTKQNGGNLSKSINYVLDDVTGDFIILCGHDDRYSSDLLENAVKRQIETGADVVIPDQCLFHPGRPDRNYYMIGTGRFKSNDDPSIDRSIVLTNYEAVKKSIDWQINILGLYKTSIIKKHKFCEDGMNTDEYSHRVFLYDANKIAFSTGTYFYYQIETSITKAISVSRFNIFKCDELLYSFLEKNNFEQDILNKCLKLTIKKYFGLKKKFYRNYENFSEVESEQIRSFFEEGYNNILSHLKNKFYFKLKDKMIDCIYYKIKVQHKSGHKKQ